MRSAERTSYVRDENGIQGFCLRTWRKQTVWRRRSSWDEMADGRILVGSIWLRIRTSCSFYEKGNETLGSIKCRYEYFI